MTSDHRKAGHMAWKRAVGRRLAVGLLAGSVLAGGLPSLLKAADPDAQASDSFAPATKPGARDKRVSLNFKAASWSKVLNRVARHAGLTLIMAQTPPGQFTRNDLNQYTVAEAIWTLNRDLQHVGYRLLRQGDFLMVMDLDGLRSDHQPSSSRLRRATDGW